MTFWIRYPSFTFRPHSTSHFYQLAIRFASLMDTLLHPTQSLDVNSLLAFDSDLTVLLSYVCNESERLIASSVLEHSKQQRNCAGAATNTRTNNLAPLSINCWSHGRVPCTTTFPEHSSMSCRGRAPSPLSSSMHLHLPPLIPYLSRHSQTA